jgi:SAM-dependent methyltransferase
VPDINWNQAIWGQDYDWSQVGEEWSEAWGGSSAQWFGSLLPRLRSFVPCNSILEIAPGYGRWTRFLLSLSQNYVGVDLSARCVEACRSAFDKGEFLVNDGLSLSGISESQKFDLVFSFDSLVHAELNVFENYIPQILAKLSPKGVAFLHHSNLAMLGGSLRTQHHHYRATSVSAELVRKLICDLGGKLLRQEIITWGSTDYLDCLTLFSRAGAYGNAGEVTVNSDFSKEAASIKASIAPWSFQ